MGAAVYKKTVLSSTPPREEGVSPLAPQEKPPGEAPPRKCVSPPIVWADTHFGVLPPFLTPPAGED